MPRFSLSLALRRLKSVSLQKMQIGCVRSFLNDIPSSESSPDTGWSTPHCFALKRPTKRGGQRTNTSNDRDLPRHVLNFNTGCPRRLSRGLQGSVSAPDDHMAFWTARTLTLQTCLNAEDLLISEDSRAREMLSVCGAVLRPEIWKPFLVHFLYSHK